MQEIIKVKSQIIQAALDLAAIKSWNDITLTDIADNAGVEHDVVLTVFRDKMDVLIALNNQIDDALTDSFPEENNDDETIRDRLFDIMMERFDLMNDHRAAYLSILNSVTMHPKDAFTSLPFLYQSISHMLGLAGGEIATGRSALKSIALSALYLKILRDWVKDDSADMAATMASVDKALGYIDKYESQLG